MGLPIIGAYPSVSSYRVSSLSAKRFLDLSVWLHMCQTSGEFFPDFGTDCAIDNKNELFDDLLV